MTCFCLAISAERQTESGSLAHFAQDGYTSQGEAYGTFIRRHFPMCKNLDRNSILDAGWDSYPWKRHADLGEIGTTSPGVAAR